MEEGDSPARAEGAFVTQDNLPLNLKAVFFVRVDGNPYVVKHVREDLKHNGVTLESATISLLEESGSQSLARTMKTAATT